MSAPPPAVSADLDQVRMIDRLADLTLVVFLASGFWYWQLVWGNDISRTRELMLLYCILGLTLFKRPWRHAPCAVVLPSLGLLVLASVGFAAWWIQLDSMLAVNYWSEPLTDAALLLFGVAFARSRWHVWRWILIWASVLVGAFQVVALLAGATARGYVSSAPAFYGARPIGAPLALLMVLGFVLVLTEVRLTFWSRVGLGSFLGLGVVLAQHRSVWVALVIACVLLAVSLRRERARSDAWIPLLATSVLFLLAVTLPLVGVRLLPGMNAGSESRRGLPAAATSSGTLEWRIDMWMSRLEAPRSVWQWIWGSSLGQTPAFGPSSDVMNKHISAHNLLLDVQLMTGLVGLALVVLVFVAAVWRGDRLGGIPVFLWGSVGFGAFYLWPTWTWLVLGAGASLAWLRGNPHGGGAGRGAVRGLDGTAPVTDSASPGSA